MTKRNFLHFFVVFFISLPLCFVEALASGDKRIDESYLPYNKVSSSEKCDNNPSDFTCAAKRVMPTVVNIATEQRKSFNHNPGGYSLPEELREFFEKMEPFFGNNNQIHPDRLVRSLGSGFLISKDGIIVTNYHVISNAEKIKITLSQCSFTCNQYDAKVLGFDKKTDLAILKIDAERDLPYAEFGDSLDLEPGQRVMAVGNPFGLGGSVTVGVISALSRDINFSQATDYIQTDVALNSGNSGGPLCNIKGEVVGINTAIYSPSGGSVGVGFALPSETAKSVAHFLSSGKNVERGWIGIRIQEITNDIQESLGGSISGVIIAGVESGSPADKAGAKVGDVLIELDGKKIENSRRLSQSVSKYKVGQNAKFSIIRDIKTRNKVALNIKIGKMQEDNGNTSEDNSIEIAGFVVSNLDKELRSSYNISSDIEGVVVVVVKDSHFSPIKKGDVIVGVGNNKLIKNIKEFKSYVTESQKKNSSILLMVNRMGHIVFVSLKLDQN